MCSCQKMLFTYILIYILKISHEHIEKDLMNNLGIILNSYDVFWNFRMFLGIYRRDDEQLSLTST